MVPRFAFVWIRMSLWLALNLVCVIAMADGADVIGRAGEFGFQTGTRGAVANRRMADQLYKQALEDEKKAWAGGIPNVGLLAKALQESKDAKAADDQAKEMARAALHASNTGAHSGDFIHERYGIVDEAKLKELSSTNSPHAAQVEKTLGGYGLKMSSDKMALQTPFGKFSTNVEDSALLKAASAIAKTLGYSAGEVEKGQKQAIADRDALSKKTVAELDKEIGDRAKSKAVSAAVAAIAAGRGPASESESKNDDGDKVIGATAGAESVKNFDGSVTAPVTTSLTEAELQVLNNRKAMGRQMGLHDVDPIGRSTQDIFQMIHTRYQSLNTDGRFYTK